MSFLLGNVKEWAHLRKEIQHKEVVNVLLILSFFYSIIGILLYRAEIVMAERIGAAKSVCNDTLNNKEPQKDKEMHLLFEKNPVL